jgi:hypothetical protein
MMCLFLGANLHLYTDLQALKEPVLKVIVCYQPFADFITGEPEKIPMPCDMRKYPDNWPDVRRAVLLRAGGRQDDPRIGARCEKCGVRNYAVGHRDAQGNFIPARGNIYYDDYQYAVSYGEAREAADHINEWCDEFPKSVVIVLTVAHLEDPSPQNVKMSNLAALCQRCHNCFDQKMRQENAAKTRRNKSKQPELFELNKNLSG